MPHRRLRDADRIEGERAPRRVLTPTGVLLSVSFAQPHFRRPLLLAPEFSWGLAQSQFRVDGGLHHSFYALRKGTRGPGDQPVALPGYDPGAHAVTGGTMHSHMEREDFLSFMEV